ncbi:MAG: matrixin family metalloprotease [Syntrophales bacterium]
MIEFKKTLGFGLLLLLAIAAALFVYILRTPGPCQKPLTYRIVQVDGRFGLTHAEFAAAVRKAAAVWGHPLSRELFREDPNGVIGISLVYDYRQETTQHLKQIHTRMSGTKESLEGMKMRYEGMKSEYERTRASLESDLHAYNARIHAFNREVESWNRQGGAPEAQRGRLTAEKSEIAAMGENLRVRQDNARRMADELNSMVQSFNEVVGRQNQDVDQYRDVGSRLGGEFQEGYFKKKDGRQSITVYHYDNEPRLVRLLVHEFGHALGLEHSSNPDAVMYRLNRSDTAELTADDIAALRSRCQAK